MGVVARFRESMPVILFGLLIAFLVTIIFQWGLNWYGSRNTLAMKTEVWDLVRLNESFELQVRALDKNVMQLSSNINSLSTSTLVERTARVERILIQLDGQVRSLQQIISPKGATDVLTVARMKDEILAREEFKKQVDQKLKVVEDRMTTTDGKLDKIQYWIWGILLTVISGLITATIFLLKRMSGFAATIPTTPAQQPSSAGG